MFTSDIHIAARRGRNCKRGNHNKKCGKIKGVKYVFRNQKTPVNTHPENSWNTIPSQAFLSNPWVTQGVPGVKVITSGFNSRADSESKMPYTHGSNSQRFRSYEFLKYNK
jgi:hypothetical protein